MGGDGGLRERRNPPCEVQQGLVFGLVFIIGHQEVQGFVPARGGMEIDFG